MRSPIVRIGALAVVAATLLGAGAAFAQATKPAPGAPAPAGQPQPQGPIKLDLIALQNPWVKVCNKDPSGAKELCRITREFGQQAGQAPTLVVAVDQVTGDDKRIAHFLLPLGLLLRPGFRLILDKSEPIEGKFALCFQNGCFGDADLNKEAWAALRKAQIASVVVRNPANGEVTFNIPLKDFVAAVDGPAMDPKVLEQQSEALQKQLEEKARQQREQLEKQSGAAPAAPAAPAPAPAPAATPAKP